MAVTQNPARQNLCLTTDMKQKSSLSCRKCRLLCLGGTKPWTVHFPKEGGSITIHTRPSEWYFVELRLGDGNPYFGKRYSYGSPYPEDQLEYMYPIEKVYTIKESIQQKRHCYRPYSKKIEWVTVERTDSINFTSFTITVDSNTTGKDRSYAVMLESAAVSGTQSGN